MLVLGRKEGERIVVHRGDEEIVFTCVEVRRGRARIGIDAPRDWGIDREELLQDAGVPASGVLDTAH